MLWTIDHGARSSLQDQLAACVRRALTDGDLVAGDRLPPAQELADAVDVDRNTVLAAYRQLRDAGVLEFRRGRGVRVAEHAEGRSAHDRAALDHAIGDLVGLARAQGYDRDELIALVDTALNDSQLAGTPTRPDPQPTR